MARGRLAQGSFAWGETSDQIGGRMDLDQYKASARVLDNYQVLELSAFTRRAGTRFVARAKYGNLLAALVPFTFSTGQSYLLEVGQGYIRFYRNSARLESGGSPIEVSTPYLAADVRTLKTAQSADVLNLAHNLYRPRKLERYSETIWKLRTLESGSTGALPSVEYGERPVATLTPSAVSGVVTLTASAPQFFEADVSRDVLVVAGASVSARAFISAFTDSQHVTAIVTQNFANTAAIAATDWKITGSPRTTIDVSIKDPVLATITLTLAVPGWRATDLGKYVHVNGGVVRLTNIVNSLTAQGIILSVLSIVQPAFTGAWSLEEEAWSVDNGFPAAVVYYQGRAWWAGSPAQPDTVWGSKSGDYENFAVGILDDDGIEYPLLSSQVNPIAWLAATNKLLAGTTGEIFSIEGGPSEILTPSNVQAKPTVAYGARREATPVAIGPALVYPTVSGLKLRELVFDIYTERFLAPDLLLLANHLTRARKTRTGITPRGLVRIAHQREPRSTIWGVTDDGRDLSCTYLREQNVVGWNPNPTQGTVLDVAVIPREDGTGDEVYLLVRRHIAGADRVFVEVVDDRGLIYDRLHVDCGITVDGIGRTQVQPGAGVQTAGADVTFSAAAATFSAADIGREIWEVDGPGQAVIITFTSAIIVTATIREPFSTEDAMAAGAWGVARQVVEGIGHLEGATVKVVGDGAPQSDRVVYGGAITAESFAIAFEVGLGYTSKLVTQRPPIDGHEGQPKAQPQILVRVLESKGLKINGKRARKFPDVGLYSGDVTEEHLGISNDGLVTIEQDQPLPSTVLLVQALVNVSQG